VGIIARLGRVDRRLLIKTGRRSGDPATALRFHAVARLAAGFSTVRVARDLDVARSTVVASAGRFRREGAYGLYDRRRFNGTTKANYPFRKRVAELLRSAPEQFGWRRPTWTRELLRLQMQLEKFPLVAACTMGRVLACLGARLGTPKPVVQCPWSRDARERRLRQIRALESQASLQEPVLYEDEVDIQLNPKVGREWMLPGHQRRLVTPGKNQRFYLAGAVDVRTGRLHTTGGTSKNAPLFCDLLRLLAARYPRAERIHLIVDNYGIHSAHRTRQQLEALNGRVVLHFLPPYCPDANRIERVWQDLHANVTRNHRCRTMRRLLANARHYLSGYVWRRSTGIHALLRAA
jgi:transposase